MFLNLRLYLEAAVVVLMAAAIIFLKFDVAVKEHKIISVTTELNTANNRLTQAGALISTQNQAVEALKNQAIINGKIAQSNLQKVRKLTATIYKQADAIAATKGSTCDDAMQLLNSESGELPQ